MKIGINERYEIKQINEITDTTLTILEIPDDTFPSDWDTETILKYCYKDDGHSIAIYPYEKITSRIV